MIARAVAHALLLLLLAGCGTLKLAERDPRPFDLVGRVFVSYSGGAVTSNVRWQHQPAADEIWLMTPTGQTLAHIVDGPEGAILTRYDQKQFRSSSVETLTRQALGWALPLSLLQYWVRGAPAPGTRVEQERRGDDKRLLALSQDAWQIAFTYADEVSRATPVRRLQMNDGSNEIRFVIDTWRDVNAP